MERFGVDTDWSSERLIKAQPWAINSYFGSMFERDHYPSKAQFGAYLRTKLTGASEQEISFVSAGLPEAYPRARMAAAAQKIRNSRAMNWEFQPWSGPEPGQIAQEVRERAAARVGLKDSRGVVIADSTTQALSLFKIFGHFDKPSQPKMPDVPQQLLAHYGEDTWPRPSPHQGTVITTSLENASVLRQLFIDGPEDGKITSFSNNPPGEAPPEDEQEDLPIISEREFARGRLQQNRILPVMVNFTGNSNAQRLANVEKTIEGMAQALAGEIPELPADFDPREEVWRELWIEKLRSSRGQEFVAQTTFLMSLVDRVNGEILPAREIREKVLEVWTRCFPGCDRPLFVLDAAQGVGNLPEVDFHELGWDLMAASPHKTMGSETLGLLFFDPENPRLKGFKENLRELRASEFSIRQGMFDPRLKIVPNNPNHLNYADLVGFIKSDEINQDTYESFGKDFSPIHERRLLLRNHCLQRLQEVAREVGLNFLEAPIENPSSFILSGTFDKLAEIHPKERDAWIEQHRRFGSYGDHLHRRPTGYRIAAALADLGILVNFLDEPGCFRFAFRPDHTIEDIEKLAHNFKQVLESAVSGALYQ